VTPERVRGLEQHQHPVGRKTRCREQQHLLVHVDPDLVGEPQERLDPDDPLDVEASSLAGTVVVLVGAYLTSRRAMNDLS
jgi:hypothetical protein